MRDLASGDLMPSRPGDRFHGPNGYLQLLGYEPQDFLADGAHVVVPIKQSGRGKSSALGIEEGIINVWKLRRGKCVELRILSTIEEALEATRPPN